MNRNKSQDRDRPAAPPAISALPQGSLGAWLRTQREARGVSLREIADSSKISLRYLEALELDRFDVLPAPVFTRGFLKEYARVVGLDADEVVNLYLLTVDDTVPQLPPAEPRVAARGSSGPSPFGYGLVLGLAVVLFLGVAAGLSWWAQRRGREPAVVAAPVAAVPRPASPAAAGAATTPIAPPLATAPVATLPGVPPAPEPAVAPASPAPAAAPAPAASATPAPASGPLRVVLEFSEDCWVEFVVDGRRRTSELRTSGEVLTIEAEDSVLLTLGNVPAVRVEVDGRPFALPANAARVVRDLRIDRAAGTRPGASGPATP